ncbi:MAG: 4Fe-4S binding protein [Candidatus Margulisbacteria bacterium]|nr:4Fe-4S binding protein [Candidatus Margulisiibacteriota bacterium]
MNQKPKIDFEQLKRGGVVKLKEKDMFSVWVRAVCCNMDARKLKMVADIAEEFGRGIVLFTTRQFPIIPHIHFKDLETVREKLKEVNLMLDRCGARVRSADVCYDANICPHAVTNPITLGEKIDQYWRDDPGGHKIKISIVGCSKQCTSPRVLSDLGFVGTEQGYAAYLGGRLGLKPFIGIKVAEKLSEDQCVKLIDNFFVFLRREGKEGERSADLINRLGIEKVKAEINKDLSAAVGTKPYICDTKLGEKVGTNKVILRVRATCGEVTSSQTRKVADLSEKYGLGFVHFSVRGTPEIPGVSKENVPAIAHELAGVGLELLDKGTDNLQSCFGSYCTNGIVDAQGLLRKVEKIIQKLGINNLNLKIAASGCPNNCAVSLISDIGFWGVIEPIVNLDKCTGCAICVSACKVNAIEIRDKKAVIDPNKCKGCMDCILACPFDAIVGGKRGFAVSIGGRGGFSPSDSREGETKLGQVIAEFVSEEEALQITEGRLKKFKEEGL